MGIRRAKRSAVPKKPKGIPQEKWDLTLTVATCPKCKMIDERTMLLCDKHKPLGPKLGTVIG